MFINAGGGSAAEEEKDDVVGTCAYKCCASASEGVLGVI